MYMYRSLYIFVDAVLGGSIATGVGDLSTGEGIGNIDRTFTRVSQREGYLLCPPRMFWGKARFKGFRGFGV